MTSLPGPLDVGDAERDRVRRRPAPARAAASASSGRRRRSGCPLANALRSRPLTSRGERGQHDLKTGACSTASPAGCASAGRRRLRAGRAGNGRRAAAAACRRSSRSRSPPRWRPAGMPGRRSSRCRCRRSSAAPPSRRPTPTPQKASSAVGGSKIRSRVSRAGGRNALRQGPSRARSCRSRSARRPRPSAARVASTSASA